MSRKTSRADMNTETIQLVRGGGEIKKIRLDDPEKQRTFDGQLAIGLIDDGRWILSIESYERRPLELILTAEQADELTKILRR